MIPRIDPIRCPETGGQQAHCQTSLAARSHGHEASGLPHALAAPPVEPRPRDRRIHSLANINGSRLGYSISMWSEPHIGLAEQISNNRVHGYLE